MIVASVKLLDVLNEAGFRDLIGRIPLEPNIEVLN